MFFAPLFVYVMMARNRSVWLQVCVLALLFLGGGVFGVTLSGRLAPDSILAQFVGLFSFSVPFVVGLQWWLGLAIAVALWRAVRRGRGGVRHRHGANEIPAGAIAFVPACVLLVGFAGLMIGLLGSSLGIVATFGLYLALGYGVACWLFARGGYLPFPQE